MSPIGRSPQGEYVAEVRRTAADVPIVVGALGPQMLRLAGRISGGAALNWCTPSGCGSRERSGGATMIEYLRVCVDADVAAARDALARQILAYALLVRPSGSSGYRAHFERMGFGEELAFLESRRASGANDGELANEMPERCHTFRAAGTGDWRQGVARVDRARPRRRIVRAHPTSGRHRTGPRDRRVRPARAAERHRHPVHYQWQQRRTRPSQLRLIDRVRTAPADRHREAAGWACGDARARMASSSCPHAAARGMRRDDDRRSRREELAHPGGVHHRGGFQCGICTGQIVAATALAAHPTHRSSIAEWMMGTARELDTTASRAIKKAAG
jgi:hypothetical protein